VNVVTVQQANNPKPGVVRTPTELGAIRKSVGVFSL
jgi:hypothetical protein